LLLIWLNSTEWGGVDILVTRFAAYLRDRDCNFAILCPPNWRIRNDLPWARFVSAEDLESIAPSVSHIFFPSVAALRDESVPWESLRRARVFTMILQFNDPLVRFVPLAHRLLNRFGYGSAGWLRRVFGRHVSLVSGLFRLMVDGKSIAAMDGSTRSSLPFFYPGVPAPQTMIPLPVPLGALERAGNLPSDTLAVGYLGRIDFFKWTALRPFILHDLAPIAARRPVRLVAIAAGSHLPELKAACERAGVDLDLHPFMPNEEARRFLRERCHFAVAMGTASLDLAAAGLPCIFIDPAGRLDAPPQELFRFVHEAVDFNVGEFRDVPNHIGGLRTLEETIAMVEREDLSLASRQYVAEHHRPDRCFHLLLQHIRSSDLRAADIFPTLREIQQSFDSAGRRYHWLTRYMPRLWNG
jgi:hypothetical protein